MKYGILGGTFNPPHKGHIAMATKAMEEFALDKVIWLPTGNSYMKTGVLEKNHRFEMTKLCTEESEFFEISDLESRENGPSYSYVTLKKLKELYQDATLCFIIGEDSFWAFDTWKNYSEIFSLANLMVFRRKSETEDRIEEKNAMLMEKKAYYEEKYEAKILFAELDVPISSTEIREKVSQGISVSDFVTPKVEEYILTHDLYRIK